ncbi:MAG: FAD-binding oxidoreductase [Gemmatimonadaceae bacterium]|nr:FAD-binding oxidoreductase [Gemmatimonadaceae bacterium]
MAGGAVGPGIILDLSRMNAIGEIDRQAMTVQAEPGVICRTVDDAARKAGLRFPVDPSSAPFCTIGGMVSTNAAGPHSLKFGAMRKWVSSLDCVFADGTRARLTRGSPPPSNALLEKFLDREGEIRKEWSAAASDHARLRKDSSGYALARYFETGDLLDLLVGSEGTLAIVVSVELSLAPLASHTSSLLASFPSLESAARGAEIARTSGASACELLDKTFLELAATAPESTDASRERARKSAAVLLVEMEDAEESVGVKRTDQLKAALQGSGADTVEVALSADSEKEVWELRHAASPILSRLKNAISMQFIEDGVVPPEKLPEYVQGVRDALARRAIPGVIFGHAGDAHVHVNPLIDVTNPSWRDSMAALLEDVVTLTAQLGGSLCGEHGDGRLRTPLMGRVWSAPAMRAFEGVKSCFDPHGLLNPGVKVPIAGETSLGAIKYDPALPSLTGDVRRILDDLVARRGYADFRLSLVDGIS